MKFTKGDIVHTVAKDSNGMNVIGIVVDVDYKKHLYAVCVDTRIGDDGCFWVEEKEVY